MTDRHRRPFTHPVRGQNGGPAGWCRQEGRRSVGLVMLGKQDLAALHAQMRCDEASYPHPLSQCILHCLREGPPRSRKRTESRCEDAVEFKHRPFVKYYGVEGFGLHTSMRETPFDGQHRKGRVVLAAREALLLNHGDWEAVDHQCSRRIMVV